MSRLEDRLAALGPVRPTPMRPPAGVPLPFEFAGVAGRRAYVSGRDPQRPDGSPAPSFGRLGRELDVDRGHAVDIPVQIEAEVEIDA